MQKCNKSKCDLRCCFPVEYWFTMCDQECLSNSNSIVFPAEINLFNAESNHPLRLHCSARCRCVHVCVRVFVCVCVHAWDKDHLCSGGSQWIWSQSALCQLAFDLSVSRLRLRLSHLAGHTRFPPSLSLPFPFLLPPHRCIQRVHLQASTVDTHTLLRVAHTHVFQWLMLSCSKEKSSLKANVSQSRFGAAYVLRNITETRLRNNCIMFNLRDVPTDLTHIYNTVLQITFSYNVNICAMNCGEAELFILFPFHEKFQARKRALVSCTPTNVRHVWYHSKDRSGGISKATSERHCRDAGGRQQYAQKQSWMDTAAKKKIRDAHRSLSIVHIMPLRW